MRLQSATGTTRVDVGPAVEVRDGHFEVNKRTLARAEGIKRLLASHTWADSLDLRIFLDGFDAGEEYCKVSPLERGDSQGLPQTHEFPNIDDHPLESGLSEN